MTDQLKLTPNVIARLTPDDRELIAERDELEARIQKLRAFIMSSIVFDKVYSTHEQVLCRRQLVAMQGYHRALCERVDIIMEARI